MRGLEAFADIIKPAEPLAPLTYLQVGGPAEALVEPRSSGELAALVEQCFHHGIPFRVLGGGCNIVIQDEGVRGVVLRLTAPAFTQIKVEGRRVSAGAGAPLAALITQSARHGLAGLEVLVGILGTVGGALRRNAGDRSGEIGPFVRHVEVVSARGQMQTRERDDLHFVYHSSDIDEPVIVAGEFELETDQPDAIVKRMRKAWIQRKAAQPLSFQSAVPMFKDLPSYNPSALIDQAGMARTRVGGVEVSERDANYMVVHPGASSRDVLRLIDMVQSRVQERFGVQMELQLVIW